MTETVVMGRPFLVGIVAATVVGQPCRTSLANLIEIATECAAGAAA